MTVVHTRAEWTTRVVPNPVPQRNVGTAFVHHEGGGVRGVPANKAAVLHGIEEMVVAKGYTSIDYNMMVFQDGSIWEGRGWAHEDGATLGWNARSVSVCAVGNFEIEAAPDALVAGIAEAIGLAKSGGWLAGDGDILGHRDSGFSTACPGKNLYARLPEIRAGGTSPPDDQPARLEEPSMPKRFTFNGQPLHSVYVTPDERLRHDYYNGTKWLTDYPAEIQLPSARFQVDQTLDVGTKENGTSVNPIDILGIGKLGEFVHVFWTGTAWATEVFT